MTTNNIYSKCSSTKNIVAYFDFDGTLTNKDTLIPFLIHVVGWCRFILKLPRLLPIAILYLLNIVSNEEAKDRTLIILISGYDFTVLNEKAKSFAELKLSRYIKPEVFSKLEYHFEHGHTIIIVSANLAIYLKHFALIHEIDDVIATEIEFKDQVCTGCLATNNCYGPEKVNRIVDYLHQQKISFTYSYGYGNSHGDHELLNYVDEGYFINGDQISSWELEDR
jgi:phosphatidylglycerophosphatase C